MTWSAAGCAAHRTLDLQSAKAANLFRLRPLSASAVLYGFTHVAAWPQERASSGRLTEEILRRASTELHAATNLKRLKPFEVTETGD
jgi:cbb3-type cytochrome oxidase subunit 1